MALLFLVPLAGHVTLALLVRGWVDDAIAGEGRTIAIAYDTIRVGPFAQSITLYEPRAKVKGRSVPIMAAQRVSLTRASSLLDWFMDGRFDLTLTLNEVQQDRDWLQGQGAGKAQLRALEALGIGNGEGGARLHTRYEPDTRRMATTLAYRGGDGSGPTAQMHWVAEDVARADIEALGELRMPQIDVAELTTQYATPERGEQFATFAEQSGMSESTFLRALMLPIPYQRGHDQLRERGLQIDHFHIAPLLSGVTVEGIRPADGTDTSALWRINRFRVTGLALALRGGQPVVQRLETSLDGAQVDMTRLRGELARFLAAAGPRQPQLAIEASYRHNPETGALILAPVTVEGDAMASVEASLRLTDVRPAQLGQHPTMALLGGAVDEANIHYADDGFANRLLTTLAKRQGTSPGETRRWLKDEAQDKLPGVLGGRSEANLPALERFIDHPDRLSLRAAPAASVPIRVLAAAAASGRYATIAERLAIRASKDVSR